MSVTTTSYRAPSSFRLAASPEFSVSTLCPSRRKAMSSMVQMERSSSQTRMLPMRSSPGREGGCGTGPQHRRRRTASLSLQSAGRWLCRQAPQTQNEYRATARVGARPNLAFMGLHDLVNDGQAESGAPLELRLEGLKNLLN